MIRLRLVKVKQRNESEDAKRNAIILPWIPCLYQVSVLIEKG